MNWNEMNNIDLPSLQSIQLGPSALQGRNDESTLLTLRSNNELIGYDLCCRSSKSNVTNIWIC